MDLEWYLSLLLFGILHIVLALMLLQDLAKRNRVIGGHKAPWAILIIFITFIGSLLYLVCHPRIFLDKD